MLIQHFFDRFSLGALFILTFVLMAAFIEFGYRLGAIRQEKRVKAQTAQVRAIMGATLGLLAFMLAFSFANAQTHFETRVANMVEEARLASNAFMQADFMQEPRRSKAKNMLRDYINDRLRFRELAEEGRLPEAFKLIEKSESMQRELWALAVENEKRERTAGEPKVQKEPFMMTVIGLIDIHVLRLQAAVGNRIPVIIWITLYLTAIMAMVVMGYQAGLTGKRSPVATLTLALAFSAVMMLIMDLDRPMMSMFDLNDQVMVNLVGRMDLELGQNGSVGN